MYFTPNLNFIILRLLDTAEYYSLVRVKNFLRIHYLVNTNM
jgi:hypothetical protein